MNKNVMKFQNATKNIILGDCINIYKNLAICFVIEDGINVILKVEK